MKKFLATAVFILLVSYCFGDTKNTMFAIPFYTPETSLGASLVDIFYFRQKDQNYYSSLNTFAMYTLKNQFVVGIVPSIYLDSGNYLIEGRLNFVNFKKKFFGIGNNASKDNEEDFVNRDTGFGISVSRRIFKKMMFGIQYGYDSMSAHNIDENGTLQFNNTDGTVSGIGAKLKYDTRNTNIFPTKGFILNAEYMLYNDKFSSDYDFTKTSVDFRNYVEFYKNKLIFSCQLYGEFINGNAPVQKLSAIGGANLMRGFYAGRYIDNILLALQPELKIKITNVVYLALFAGAGNVYENIENIDLGKIKFAGGSGLRIKIKNNPRINFRLDFAASNESTGTYFSIMEAF